MSALRKPSTALRDPAWLRVILLTVALAFVALFLVLYLLAFGLAACSGIAVESVRKRRLGRPSPSAL